MAQEEILQIPAGVVIDAMNPRTQKYFDQLYDASGNLIYGEITAKPIPPKLKKDDPKQFLERNKNTLNRINNALYGKTQDSVPEIVTIDDETDGAGAQEEHVVEEKDEHDIEKEDMQDYNEGDEERDRMAEFIRSEMQEDDEGNVDIIPVEKELATTKTRRPKGKKDKLSYNEEKSTKFIEKKAIIQQYVWNITDRNKNDEPVGEMRRVELSGHMQRFAAKPIYHETTGDEDEELTGPPRLNLKIEQYIPEDVIEQVRDVELGYKQIHQYTIGPLGVEIPYKPPTRTTQEYIDDILENTRNPHKYIHEGILYIPSGKLTKSLIYERNDEHEGTKVKFVIGNRRIYAIVTKIIAPSYQDMRENMILHINIEASTDLNDNDRRDEDGIYEVEYKDPSLKVYTYGLEHLETKKNKRLYGQFTIGDRIYHGEIIKTFTPQTQPKLLAESRYSVGLDAPNQFGIFESNDSSKIDESLEYEVLYSDPTLEIDYVIRADAYEKHIRPEDIYSSSVNEQMRAFFREFFLSKLKMGLDIQDTTSSKPEMMNLCGKMVSKKEFLESEFKTWYFNTYYHNISLQVDALLEHDVVFQNQVTDKLKENVEMYTENSVMDRFVSRNPNIFNMQIQEVQEYLTQKREKDELEAMLLTSLQKKLYGLQSEERVVKDFKLQRGNLEHSEHYVEKKEVYIPERRKFTSYSASLEELKLLQKEYAKTLDTEILNKMWDLYENLARQDTEITETQMNKRIEEIRQEFDMHIRFIRNDVDREMIFEQQLVLMQRLGNMIYKRSRRDLLVIFTDVISTYIYNHIGIPEGAIDMTLTQLELLNPGILGATNQTIIRRLSDKVVMDDIILRKRLQDDEKHEEILHQIKHKLQPELIYLDMINKQLDDTIDYLKIKGKKKSSIETKMLTFLQKRDIDEALIVMKEDTDYGNRERMYKIFMPVMKMIMNKNIKTRDETDILEKYNASSPEMTHLQFNYSVNAVLRYLEYLDTKMDETIDIYVHFVGMTPEDQANENKDILALVDSINQNLNYVDIQFLIAIKGGDIEQITTKLSKKGLQEYEKLILNELQGKNRYQQELINYYMEKINKKQPDDKKKSSNEVQFLCEIREKGFIAIRDEYEKYGKKAKNTFMVHRKTIIEKLAEAKDAEIKLNNMIDDLKLTKSEMNNFCMIMKPGGIQDLLNPAKRLQANEINLELQSFIEELPEKHEYESLGNIIHKIIPQYMTVSKKIVEYLEKLDNKSPTHARILEQLKLYSVDKSDLELISKYIQVVNTIIKDNSKKFNLGMDTELEIVANPETRKQLDDAVNKPLYEQIATLNYQVKNKMLKHKGVEFRIIPPQEQSLEDVAFKVLPDYVKTINKVVVQLNNKDIKTKFENNVYETITDIIPNCCVNDVLIDLDNLFNMIRTIHSVRLDVRNVSEITLTDDERQILSRTYTNTILRGADLENYVKRMISYHYDENDVQKIYDKFVARNVGIVYTTSSTIIQQLENKNRNPLETSILYELKRYVESTGKDELDGDELNKALYEVVKTYITSDRIPTRNQIYVELRKPILQKKYDEYLIENRNKLYNKFLKDQQTELEVKYEELVKLNETCEQIPISLPQTTKSEIVTYYEKQIEEYEKTVFDSSITVFSYLKRGLEPIIYIHSELSDLSSKTHYFKAKLKAKAIRVSHLADASSVYYFPEFFMNTKLTESDWNMVERILQKELAYVCKLFSTQYIRLLNPTIRLQDVSVNKLDIFNIQDKKRNANNKLLVKPQDVCKFDSGTGEGITDENLVICMYDGKFVCRDITIIIQEIKDGMNNSYTNKPYDKEFIDKIRNIYSDEFTRGLEVPKQTKPQKPTTKPQQTKPPRPTTRPVRIIKEEFIE